VGNCGQAQISARHTGMKGSSHGCRAVIEAETLRQAQRVQVRLPAGSAVRARGLPEDLLEALAREEHLALGPPGVGPGHTVLPFHVVPGVNSDFEIRVPHPAHHVGAAATDVGTGQERPVEQGRNP